MTTDKSNIPLTAQQRDLPNCVLNESIDACVRVDELKTVRTADTDHLKLFHLKQKVQISKKFGVFVLERIISFHAPFSSLGNGNAFIISVTII